MRYDNWRDSLDSEEEVLAAEEKIIEEIEVLEQMSRMTKNEAIISAIDSEIHKLRSLLYCDCDGYEICNRCLSDARRERYGDHLHDIDCACCGDNSLPYRGADY